jgi:hypothetical protein
MNEYGKMLPPLDLATIALHLTTTTIGASTWGCVISSLIFIMRLYQTDSFEENRLHLTLYVDMEKRVDDISPK